MANRENERRRALPSPSTTQSLREDVGQDLSSLAIAYLPEQRYPTLFYESSIENHIGKIYSTPSGSGAGHKRKHEKELGQIDRFSKQARKNESTAASPCLDSKQRLESPRDDGIFEKQKLLFEETAPETKVFVIENPQKPTKQLEVRKTEQKETRDPIKYWAAHHTWPRQFLVNNQMASSNSTKKRQRILDDSQGSKDERSRSYSQSRKFGEVPEQYTAAYERHILIKGLDMDLLNGEDLISEESKKMSLNLQQITRQIIEPTIFSTKIIRKVLNFYRNRNEAIVNRDVTPLIIPSVTSLYFGGDSSLEHVIDEVNATWYDQCVLEGPRPRPDLAIGLFSSAFTEEEIDKLKRYTSVDNWTQVTMHMFFPFLMCEVKCGREGLDIADRQNMHSCSVALRALLRIEQEADKYRQEKKMNSLDRQALVFSISHDQEDARLYGHYAIVQEGKWAYYRYRIRKFDLTDNNSLLVIHNFVRNILKSYLPRHIRRLKDALAAFPDPNELPESSSLSGSGCLSLAASGISLNDGNFQQSSQDRNSDGFVIPGRPSSSQFSAAKKKEQENWLVERIDKLMKELVEERQKRKESEERMEKLLERFLDKAAN